MSEQFSETYLESNWKERYLALQGFFYFSQGVAMVAIILLPLFMQEVLELEELRALEIYGIIMIPWGVKIIYGLLTDNVSIGKFGRRKPYIVIGGISGLVGWVILPFTSTTGPFIAVALLVSISLALMDATLDSLAVDITPQKRRGAMQAVGWGLRGAGMALAGFILGILMDKDLWQLIYILPGVMMFLSSGVVLFFPEKKITLEDKIVPTDWKMYKKAFSKSSTWWVTLFMILSGTGITVVSVFTTFVSAETDLSLLYVGTGVTIFALGQFVGAGVIGLLGDYLPLIPVLIGTTVLYSGLLGTMFLISSSGIGTIYAIIVFIGAINGGYEATQMRIGMEHSVGPVGGTLYNWFMSISNLGQMTLGAWFIADLAGGSFSFPAAMQFATIFLVLALIPGIIAIRQIKKKQNTKEEVDRVEVKDF